MALDGYGDESLEKAALRSLHSIPKPEDIHRYRSADFLPGNRVVFNIHGNRYRLIVKIHYNTGQLFVRFVGMHPLYDQIDAETIE